MNELTTVKRPDDVDEQRLVKTAGHECPATGKREVIFFGVGIAGSGHPLYHPFEVKAWCPECDLEFACWFQWGGSKVVDLGAPPKRETA